MLGWVFLVKLLHAAAAAGTNSETNSGGNVSLSRLPRTLLGASVRGVAGDWDA